MDRLSIAERLPSELLLAIVQFLQPPTDLHRAPNIRTLYSACLVCRSWNAAARYVLYTDVQLVTQDTTVKFCYALARRPDLRALVRTMHIQYHAWEALYSRGLFQLRRPAYTPISLCASLRRINVHIAPSGPPTSLEDIAVFFPVGELAALRSLYIYFENVSRSGPFTRLLRRDRPSFMIRHVLPQLEELGLGGIVLDNLNAHRPCALPRLRLLSIGATRLTSESLQTMLKGGGLDFVKLELWCSIYWPSNGNIFEDCTSRSIHTLVLRGFGSCTTALALPTWPSLHDLHMPWPFIPRFHALPPTLLRFSLWNPLKGRGTRHSSSIWGLAAWICQALEAWHASAPGMAHLQIVDDSCSYAELATWRVASFLLFARCADMGIKLTVDVRVQDMAAVMRGSRSPRTVAWL